MKKLLSALLCFVLLFSITACGSSNHRPSEERDTTACPDGYSSTPISKCAKSGNGYARITLVSLIDSNKKSIAFNLNFEDQKKTLTDEEVNFNFINSKYLLSHSLSVTVG